MARAKAILRARAAAQRGEQIAERARRGAEGAPAAAQERTPPRGQPRTEERGSAAPGKRGIVKALWGRVETAIYHLIEELSGLSEDRPALGVRLAAPALRALGVPAPRVVSSVTVSRPRAAALHALLDAEGPRRFLASVERVEVGAREGTATIWAAGVEGLGRGRPGVVSLSDAPGERGAEIKAVLPGQRPRGRVARAAARLLAEAPRRRLRGDLRRLRQWIEVGEIPTTVGQPSGRRGRERT